MINKFLKFEGRKDIVRDPYSKAIINTDIVAMRAAKKRKAHEEKIDNLQTEMNEIKKLVQNVLERLNEKGNE